GTLLFREVPVDPRQRGILTIAIVVAFLRVTHLIARQEHGHALREQECRQEIELLPLTELVYALIAGWTFDAAIPTHVVIVAIAVFFAVRFVVFALVADQIGEGEAVVAGYKVQT